MPSLAKYFTGRRLLYQAAIVLATLLACELASFLVVWGQSGRPVMWAEFQQKRSDLIRRMSDSNEFIIATREEGRTLGEGANIRREVVHPYVGYVLDPTGMEGVNEFGFHRSEIEPLQDLSDDTLIVGVVGGSVAETFAEMGMPIVAKELAKHKAFVGKRVIAVNMASGGYKQPQQLMAMTYMLSEGAKFDIVINLDGFNEVALHDTENGRANTYPAYPRMWFDYVRRFTDVETRRLSGHKEYFKAEMLALAKSSSRSPYRHSLTCNAIWSLRQQRLMKQYMDLEKASSDYLVQISTDLPYYVTGPKLALGPSQESRFLAHIWAQSSLQLHRLCEANGIRYFHFLQPNQYVAGSKPMGRAEQEIAINPNYVYRPGVEKGYPLLVEEGKALVAQGVRFVDLTHVFIETETSVYIDECCHFGEVGNEILGQSVAGAIGEDYLTEPASP